MSDSNFFKDIIDALILKCFFEKIEDIHSAKIEYSIDENALVCAKREGRTAEIDLLIAMIIRDKVKRLTGDLEMVDQYLDFIKKIIPIIDESEVKIELHENNEGFDIDKFKDMFKDLDL